MSILPVNLFDAHGDVLPDRVLLEPRPDGAMHPAVAVVNALRIWAIANPAQCRAAFPKMVRTGRLVHHADGTASLAIDGKEFQVISIECRDGAVKPERVLSGARPGQPHEENYWILNPGTAGDDRLAVRIRRNELAELVESFNHLAQNPANAPIAGMTIRLG